MIVVDVKADRLADKGKIAQPALAEVLESQTANRYRYRSRSRALLGVGWPRAGR